MITKLFALLTFACSALPMVDSGIAAPVPEYTIASAFVQAYSRTDVNALASLYKDRVDHTNSGVISNSAVRAQARKYFARWPVRHWNLVGTVNTVSLGDSTKKVIFSATYDATDPQTNRHASGIAKETLILATDPSGAMKIVSQREQPSKQNSSHSDEKTSDDPGLKAAKAEYEAGSHDESARVRYVTKLADMSAKLTPKILHNPDVDAKVAYANQAGAIGQELRKHPMPRNVDSGKLSQLLLGKWESPRHVYIFRADGTYGMADTDERDKWRIDGNEYIDAFSRGPIILLDRSYFIYACGQSVIIYTREMDPESKRDQSAAGNTTATESLPGHTQVEGNAVSSNTAERSSSKPTSAIIEPSGQLAGPNKLGNIKVTFNDGHTEVVTSDGQCFGPEISKRGDILWLHMTGADRLGYPVDGKLILRTVDGKTKDLKPEYGYRYVRYSGFGGDQSTVIVMWGGRHGIPSFRKYDIATGTVLDRVSGVGDYNKLPKWAQAVAHGEDSLVNAPPQ